MDYQKVAEGACAKIEEAVAKFAFKGTPVECRRKNIPFIFPSSSHFQQ